jgi:hypothetical protein
MARPHIQVILADETIPESLQAALRRIDATASFRPLAEALRADLAPSADAVVVIVPEDAGGVAGPLRVLFDRLAEHPRATLVLKASGHGVPPLAHPATLPVTFGCELDERDLSIRISTMLAMRESLDALHHGLLANRRSGESLAGRYVKQLRLASQVQREFLPEALPAFGPASFRVVFRPVDYVSGDIYDIHRLDEEHVGIALADASGHGIPAALLTVYIKRALRGKEIENGSYRILSPDAVLRRLNDDLVDANLSECPFVAAIYAILNTRTRELTLARAGAPYPIYRTADGELRLLTPRGGVVGVLPDACFEIASLELQAGDSLLMFTDGLERIVAPHLTAHELPETLRCAINRFTDCGAPGPQPVLVGAGGPELEAAIGTAHLPAGTGKLDFGAADIEPRPSAGRAVRSGPRLVTEATTALCSVATTASALSPLYESITTSTWGAALRNDGPGVALQQLEGRQTALRRMGYPLDDLTVLCLQIAP